MCEKYTAFSTPQVQHNWEKSCSLFMHYVYLDVWKVNRIQYTSSTTQWKNRVLSVFELCLFRFETSTPHSVHLKYNTIGKNHVLFVYALCLFRCVTSTPHSVHLKNTTQRKNHVLFVYALCLFRFETRHRI